MRNYIFLLLCLFCILLLAACGNSREEKLAGKWRCDVAASMELLEQNMPGNLEGREDLVKTILSVVQAEFDMKGRKLIMDVGGVSETRSFTPQPASGDTVLLKLDDGKLLTVEFQGNDKIHSYISDDPCEQIVLLRVK